MVLEFGVIGDILKWRENYFNILGRGFLAFGGFF